MGRSKRFIEPEDIERASAIRNSLRQTYVGHWTQGDTEENVESQKDVDPVERICGELRREMTMLLVYGTIPMNELVDGCLQRVRLKGTGDEALWSNMIESMATR